MVLAFASGCDFDLGLTGPPPRPTGQLTIATETYGANPDPDGYRLDHPALKEVHLDPTDFFSIATTPGLWKVTLIDVAENCSVRGGAYKEVNLGEGGTATLRYRVDCP
jgi:hypothetical protein